MQDVLPRIAQSTGNTPRAVWFLASMAAALAAGTLVRAIGQWLHPTPHKRDLLASLRTWWALMSVLVLAGLLGRSAIVACFAVVSVLALREFFRLYQHESNRLVLAAYLIAAGQYYLVWLTPNSDRAAPLMFFTPLAVLVVLPAVRMAIAPPKDFAATLGTVQLATLVSVYGLSHAACFYILPESSNPQGGGLGWLLFLVVITETNDIAQAFFGRMLGKNKATPHISPHKTWEGFLGGIAATTVLAAALAPWITPLAEPPPRWRDAPVLGLPFFPAVLAGTIIALGGIIGDLLMSSCKRDRGVKDFGHLLPGHGGVLDRFDSLTISAPLFFYLVWLLEY
jgi:phosphatidate cytidylyltransferase